MLTAAAWTCIPTTTPRHTALSGLQAPPTPPLARSRVPTLGTRARRVPPSASLWRMASTGHRVGPTLDDVAFSRARKAAARAAALDEGWAVAQADAALRLRALQEELAAARAMVSDLERLVEDTALALEQTNAAPGDAFVLP